MQQLIDDSLTYSQ